VHFWCFGSVVSVTICLLLYLDTLGFANYRCVFVVRFIYPSQPIETYFRSWRRRRLSSFFWFRCCLGNLHLLRLWRRRRLCPFSGLLYLESSCKGRWFLVGIFSCVWEICISSVRGDPGGYVLFWVRCIWNLLAMDDGFILEYCLPY
jgi:hypothetical protein